MIMDTVVGQDIDIGHDMTGTAVGTGRTQLGLNSLEPLVKGDVVIGGQQHSQTIGKRWSHDAHSCRSK